MDEKPKDEQVFAVGDRTVMAMQSQSFLSEGEFGTIAGDPSQLPIPEMQPEVESAAAPTETAEPKSDDIVRLERKLDTVAHLLNMLNRRLDSIDMVLARMVNRDS